MPEALGAAPGDVGTFASMSELNFEQARFNMVEQQIRPWEVLDPRVLEVFSRVPREEFVPRRYRALAFADLRIPLGRGQSMMRPVEEGRLLQALDLVATDTVLEVGTGSGFLTACLASLCEHVHSVEIFEDFSVTARDSLGRQGIENVMLEVGDAAAGWTTETHFDAIAVTGSMTRLAETYKRMLKGGGRLFVVTGDSPAMEARLLTRVGDEAWSEERLFETDLQPLLHAERKPSFVL